MVLEQLRERTGLLHQRVEESVQSRSRNPVAWMSNSGGLLLRETDQFLSNIARSNYPKCISDFCFDTPNIFRTLSAMGTGGRQIFAHSLEGQPPSQWETLEDHLEAVAVRAREFAAAFGAGPWGDVLGRWHDLGKLSQAFQDRIAASDPDASEEATAGRVDHSTYGARHAAGALDKLAGKIVAFCIAGHHGSLPDATSDDEATRRSTLEYRLDERSYSIPGVSLPDTFPAAPKLTFPLPPIKRSQDVGFAVAFFTRMIFSALIDADRTATQAFCNREQASLRNQAKPTLDQLRTAIDAFLANIQSRATLTPVNQVRARVLAECLDRAKLPPGVFSLNVPTGGGKTLASLAFALHHARHHRDSGLRRVVVAIPFTSIIEQTADVYRGALGEFAALGLVEHHSNINPSRETRENKLAAENWDAPLIVTTNVQLFETLFASKATPCRKLHRLARSIIILDEAQTLPVNLLSPTLAALRELVERYGCTVVLCTATQPALERREVEFEIGLENVRPIITDAASLHAELKRVKIERAGTLTDDALASQLANERAVLCVVNTRPHAARIYDLLVSKRGSPKGCYHLSTFMCPQHRRDTLAEIRQRLIDKKACRLVSTQLIEAGVDVDFPVVYRAPAGFDSIAQAAGRCNREGKLADATGQPMLGRVVLFDTETPPPSGMLRQCAEKARELFGEHPDPLMPSAVEAYFRLVYWSRKHALDKPGVLKFFGDPRVAALPPFMFRRAADAYKLIDQEQAQIVVPYGKTGRKLRDALLKSGTVDFQFYRDAQQYVVCVQESGKLKLLEARVLIQHECGLCMLANDEAYKKTIGLVFSEAGFGPERQII